MKNDNNNSEVSNLVEIRQEGNDDFFSMIPLDAVYKLFNESDLP